eukprot:NODE_12878_length_1198_cov_3.965453.p1 GENE.NODE_12878_length_1198_cov_3.965453~~NODE_12878_length_1198_cov_3.965453.p1  ORF type:complete len:193 (+),score=36.77 NODE_12878_length_1198_cov_3.965453:146-724(+)
MSDKKWEFEKEYGHKTLPMKWHQSSGYSLYDSNPLTKKSFRKPSLPVYRRDLCPKGTSYVEREQDARWAMSAYGCHRELSFTSSLRSRAATPERRPVTTCSQLKVGSSGRDSRLAQKTMRSSSMPGSRTMVAGLSEEYGDAQRWNRTSRQPADISRRPSRLDQALEVSKGEHMLAELGSSAGSEADRLWSAP